MFLSHAPARFYLSVELGFVSCLKHFMQDIAKLWGMCIIGKEELPRWPIRERYNREVSRTIHRVQKKKHPLTFSSRYPWM